MCFVFFKQKTAYEMRISDWSSDVCSSDLGRRTRHLAFLRPVLLLDAHRDARAQRRESRYVGGRARTARAARLRFPDGRGRGDELARLSGGIEYRDLRRRPGRARGGDGRGDPGLRDDHSCRPDRGAARSDRKRVVKGKSVSVSVDLGGRRILQKKNKTKKT